MPDDLPLVIDRRPSPPAHSPWRRLLIVPLLIAAIAVFLFLLPMPLQKRLGLQSSPPPHAQTTAPPVVAGLGKLLPQSDVITLAPPFGAGDARISRLLVKEGDQVAAGAMLAEFDNQPSFAAALQSAKATLALREAGLAQTRAAVTASRQEAEAALARATLSAQTVARDFERTDRLHKTGAVTDAAYEQRRSQRDEAAREVERLTATLSRFENIGDNQADILVATRQMDAARADMRRAETDLDKAMLRAPLAATVLTIHVQPGERAGASGVMTLGDLSAMKVETEIYQNQIGRISLGNTASISADALGPDPLKGTVTRIGLEVGRQVLTDPSPAANTDARVVRVIITLDEPSAKRAARFVNLQVLARITVAAP